MLPPTEHPEVFGQHFNADIASQIAEARMLFDTLLSLQPQVTGPPAAGGGPSREDKVRAEGRGCLTFRGCHFLVFPEFIVVKCLKLESAKFDTFSSKIIEMTIFVSETTKLFVFLSIDVLNKRLMVAAFIGHIMET